MYLLFIITTITLQDRENYAEATPIKVRDYRVQYICVVLKYLINEINDILIVNIKSTCLRI